MSEIKVSKLTNRAGTGAPDFSQGVKISGTASTLLAPTRTESATEPTSPANGDTWYDTDNDTYDVYINNEWKRFIGASAAAVFSWGGDRGIQAGGARTSAANEAIDYYDITTSGNASDFGDLTESRDYISGTGSSTRSVFGGGGGTSGWKTIDYVTPSTTGNATDFGDHLYDRRNDRACGNGTRGLFGGGWTSHTGSDTIEYITIATTGNGTSFGDLTTTRQEPGAVASNTYALFAGKYASADGPHDFTIDYVTIDTTGNASDWGDLTGSSNYLIEGASDTTRGVFMGGWGSQSNGVTNEIKYISLASTGNTSDFGDLTKTRERGAATSNGTYAVYCGGLGSGVNVNDIDRITIQTTGNAADHGDLVLTSQYGAATSGAAS